MSDLQKQMEIRDLVDTTPVREKLLELKQWEKRMKAKEKELKKENNSEPMESLPIRSRVKPTTNGLTSMNGDAPNEGTSKNTEEQQDNAEQVDDEAAKNAKLANVEKERGNKLVSAKDYTNAISHYSKAIEYNAQEPAFYMNRALCHLRLEKYRLAIIDCDSALALDKTLTKAYFRRMQSNTQLENYDAALGDCIQMIKLDAENPSLRKEFDRIKQLKLNKEGGGGAAGTSVVKTPEEPYWEPRPKKLWSRFGPDEEEIKFQDKAPHLRSKKPLKRIPIVETFSPPEPVETFPDHIVDKLFNNFTGESTSNGPVASTSRSPTTLFSPLYGSFNTKSPVIGAPPSPMSSSALNMSTDRSIDDIFGGMAVLAKEQNEQEIGAIPPPPSFQLADPPHSTTIDTSSTLNDLQLEDKTDVMKPVLLPSPNQPVTEFSIPKTGVQFSSTWKSLEEGQRFHFLRQVQEKSRIIAKLGASLDDSLLTEMLDCLNSYFCPKDLNIGDILQQLSENSEMGILSMMMGENDRHIVEDLLGYVRSRQELSVDMCVRIEKVFSV